LDAINAPRKDVSTLTRAAIIIGVILLFAGVAAAGTLTGQSGSDSPTIDAPTLSTPAGATTTQDDRQDGEISGPCDEAEHANDPGCTGAAGARAEDRDDDEAGEISGPCDEAEHANDPRCTGAAGARAEDRDDDDAGEHGNSGPRNAEDNSGRGGGNSGRDHGEDD
jgi:hypothetical protein